MNRVRLRVGHVGHVVLALAAHASRQHRVALQHVLEAGEQLRHGGRRPLKDRRAHVRRRHRATPAAPRIEQPLHLAEWQAHAVALPARRENSLAGSGFSSRSAGDGLRAASTDAGRVQRGGDQADAKSKSKATRIEFSRPTRASPHTTWATTKSAACKARKSFYIYYQKVVTSSSRSYLIGSFL